MSTTKTVGLSDVRRILRGEFAIEEATVELDTALGDLDLDSLDLVELVMVLEEEYDIEISDEDAEGVRTVQDVINLVDRLSR
jgi:acyl carrier protein